MESLERILRGNGEHVERIDADHFAGVRDRQDPSVASVSCSDSRVSADGVWSAVSDGDLFTSVNVGNQVWTDVDGERVVNDAVGYAVSSLSVDLVVVLGHTGCGAVTAAYDAVLERDDLVVDTDTLPAVETDPTPPAVEAAVERLVPIVEDARAAGVVDASTPPKTAVNRLVEYAVREQVAFLADGDSVPDDVAVAGLVYDFQHAFGDVDGAAYLVSLDGETDADWLRDRLDPAYHGHVASLL